MLDDKRYEVLNALSVRMAGSPQFKIFYPVVISYPILVMNSFKFMKVSSNMFFHYKSMLLNISMSHCSRMSMAGFKNITARAFYDAAPPERRVLSIASLNSFIGAFFRAKFIFGFFPISLFCMVPYRIGSPFKLRFAKIADQFNPSALPSVMRFTLKFFCSPFPVTRTATKKMFRIIKSVIVNFKFLTARLAFNVYHSYRISYV